MRKIDFENHFATRTWVDALYANKGYPRLVDDEETGQPFLWYDSRVSQPFGGVLPRLLDLGEGRIDQMDANGVDVAVLSLTAPCVEQFEPAVGVKVAADSNDALAEAVQRHPGRFVGFAALAPKDTPAAVEELERAVKELGFRGWFTHSNFGDSYLDEKRFWPILAKAEELGVPVYIHPTVPMISEMKTYGHGMAGASFGFGTEAALVMMRLIVAGVFDVFPKLRAILGHLGEGFPFMVDRVDRPYLQGHVAPNPLAPTLKQRPSYYLKHNLTVSTSGNYLPAAFKCTVEALGIGQIVLGTDYPYESVSQCIEFLDAQRLSVPERESLLEGNALRMGILAR
jgi:predicted TIM-barrel fold metal-dependent hydrolase